MYSKRIPGEGIVEIIGNKLDTGIIQEFLRIFEPMMLNNDMEASLRKFMSTFRLAGVESQTVERVLETFGGAFFDFTTQDPSPYESKRTKKDLMKFASKKEASDFCYLLLMLHTCLHNNNLPKGMSDINWFIKSAKEICPETMKNLTDFSSMQEMFKNISEREFYSPLIRDIKSQDSFDPESVLIDINARTCQSTLTYEADIEEEDFVNCMTYTSSKFLFHYNNKFDAPSGLIKVVEDHFKKEIIQKLKSIAFGESSSDLDQQSLQPVFDLLIQNNFASEIDKHFTDSLKHFDWKFYPQAMKSTEHKLMIQKVETLLHFIGETLPYLQNMSEKIQDIVDFCYTNNYIEDSVKAKAFIKEYFQRKLSFFNEDEISEKKSIATSILNIFMGTEDLNLYNMIKHDLTISLNFKNIENVQNYSIFPTL
jgi:SOS response regulatory protein OraA/RecX